MDGPFYVDTRGPHISADVAAVSTAATAKALVPVANLPILGSNYWSYIGKAVRITMFGRLTTPASSPTIQWAFYWGNGGDANGTAIVQSGAVATVSSQTNVSWMLECIIRCRTMGATGTLFGTGNVIANQIVLANTVQPILIPATAPAASASLDLTVANVISPQIIGGSATAMTIQVHDYLFEALN